MGADVAHLAAAPSVSNASPEGPRPKSLPTGRPPVVLIAAPDELQGACRDAPPLKWLISIDLADVADAALVAELEDHLADLFPAEPQHELRTP